MGNAEGTRGEKTWGVEKSSGVVNKTERKVESRFVEMRVWEHYERETGDHAGEMMLN